jgi:hypothetical protein
MKSNKNILYIAIGTILLLMIPFVAMQFSRDVNWSLFDFVFAGVTLFGTGTAFELLSRRYDGIAYKLGIAGALGTGLFMVYSNGAVGIIGDEDNAANLMYFGVLAVGFLGSIISRLKPTGMSYTLFAQALTQVVITAIVLLTDIQETSGSSIAEVLAVNCMFLVLWLGSALMFKLAENNEAKNLV